MTYKQIVFMCLDELKNLSDDADFTEDHIIFLMNKYRRFIMKQEYEKKKFLSLLIPDYYYQVLCLCLEKVPAIEGFPCEGDYMLRTIDKIPFPTAMGITSVYPTGAFFRREIAYITTDRMRYVGYNKWMKNIVYAAMGPDGHLYIWSKNKQFLYLSGITLRGVFDDPEEARKFQCDDDGACDILDATFPFDDAFVPQLIELIVKELSGSIYRPDDRWNDSSDDLNKLQVASK